MRWFASAASVVSLAVFVAVHTARWQAGEPVLLFPDFMVFWSSGPALSQGGLSRLFDVGAFTALQNQLFAPVLARPIIARPWLYPPTFLLVSQSFAHLPYLVSALVLQSLGVVMLWFALGRRWWPLLVLLVSPAFGSAFDAGQIAAILAACIIGGLALLDESPVAAGALLAMVSFKPHLFVLLPLALCAARAWRALASCLAVTAALAVLSVLVFGLTSWQLWIGAATGPTQLIAPGSRIISTYGIQMGSVLATARMYGASNAGAWVAQVAAMGLAAASVWAVFARTTDRVQRSLTLMCATLLFAPYWMNYDLLLPCAAVTLGVGAAVRAGFRRGEALAWMTLWLLPYGMLLVQAVWHVPIAPAIVLVVLMLAVRSRVAGPITPEEPADRSAVASSSASIATLHASMAASRT